MSRCGFITIFSFFGLFDILCHNSGPSRSWQNQGRTLVVWQSPIAGQSLEVSAFLLIRSTSAACCMKTLASHNVYFSCAKHLTFHQVERLTASTQDQIRYVVHLIMPVYLVLRFLSSEVCFGHSTITHSRTRCKCHHSSSNIGGHFRRCDVRMVVDKLESAW